MKFITPMYKNAAIFALASCAAIISASAQTTPYAGDVYWTQQKNDDTSGDPSKWGISINNDTLYSPGDGTSVGEAFKEGEIDWANSNIFIDARFTGTDSNGVNHVIGINPNHLGDDKTFTVKNFTIANNWDQSVQSNKHSYWWDGNNADDNVTLKIKENFNIYSAINGGGKNIHLDVPTINIDISEKMPSNPEKNRGERNVNLEWLLSLNVDTIDIRDASYVNFSNGKNLNIKEINVSKLGDNLYFNGTKGLRIDTLNMYTEDQTNSKIHGFHLDGASDAVINNVNVTGMSSDFAANNSTNITFGDIHLTDSHWLVFQGSTNVTTGSIYLTRTNGFTGVDSSIHVKGDFIIEGKDFQEFSANSWNMKEEGFTVDGNFSITGTGSVNLNFDGSKRFIIGKNLSTNRQLELREDVYAHIGGDLNLSSGALLKYATWRNKDGTRGTSADNVGMLVDGQLNVVGGANMHIQFYKQSYSNNNNIENYHMAVGGIETNNQTFNIHLGYFHDNPDNPTTHPEKTPTTGDFSHTFVLNNAKDLEARAYLSIKNVEKQTIDNTTMQLHFIMNGAGKQQLIVDSKTLWKGSVTVNNGTLQLFNSDYDGTTRTKVDVTIGGNGKFGTIRSDKTNEKKDRSSINDLTTLDGATLLYSEENFALIVNGEINIEGLLTFEIAEVAFEDKIIENFLEWTSVFDAQNMAALTDAFNDGRMQVRDINGTLYAVKGIQTDNQMLDLIVGAVIPEPATVAAVLGGLALAFAAYRRRK